MIKQLSYKTSGTCSSLIEVETEDGRIKSAAFHGGCNGNSKGIASLVEGMPVEEAIKRLSGIRCGFRSTSCPDQLAKALKEML